MGEEERSFKVKALEEIAECFKESSNIKDKMLASTLFGVLGAFVAGEGFMNSMFRVVVAETERTSKVIRGDCLEIK